MTINDHQLRARGRAPKLTDSEVITLEVVGSYLGLSQDKALFDYFQRHYPHFFPALRGLHRTTFVRQAANLWAIKERVWCWLRDTMISYDASLSIVDSVPLPICRFARAPWCSRISSYCGFHLLISCTPAGVITGIGFAPANTHDVPLAETFLAARHHPTPRLPGVGQLSGVPYVADRVKVRRRFTHIAPVGPPLQWQGS